MTGPTGVGKSLFAVELASQLGGEIIGADAFQIYAGLPLLTAQPEAELRARVPHHLIDCVDPGESFNAARYRDCANEIVREVQSRGKRPILCGGTGLYLKAFTHGLADLPKVDAAVRAELESLSDAQLIAELQRLDPVASAVIDLKNRRRVLRAVEICRASGRPVTEVRKEWQSASRPVIGFVLLRERDELRERIRQNVARMFELGVIAEVQALDPVGETAAKAIGLTEIRSLLNGEISLSKCQELIVNATRQYAKRQLTWIRSQINFQSINLTPLEPLSIPLQQALNRVHD